MEEIQEEEREALDAIFEEDENYKKNSENKFQYKILDQDDGSEFNNFLLEFEWGKNYPDEKPEISLDSFYNIHLTEKTKNFIKMKLDEEAENNIGKGLI